MIDFLEGDIESLEPFHLVLKVQQIGFHLQISLTTYSVLHQFSPSPVRIYTTLFIREEKPILIGFATPLERALFNELIKISGIGIQTALTILSGYPPETLIHLIQMGAHQQLSSIKGIGKKTAERIVLELKDKIAYLFQKEKKPSPSLFPASPHDPAIEDAIQALISLGLNPKEAEKKIHTAVQKYGKEALDAATLIKLALQSQS
jgi:Holliday junction DNA helicase RuvA